MKIISLLLGILVASTAMAFSLFGPKTYEECLLKNMKGVSNDTAAKAVQYACMTQFMDDSAPPTKAEQAEAARLENFKREADLRRKNRADRCGVSAFGEYVQIKELNQRDNSAGAHQKAVSLIKNPLFDQNMRKISFQNNNDFAITFLRVGFVKGNMCPTDRTAYEAIITCDGHKNHQMVSSYSHGALTCDGLPKNFSGQHYCFIGIVPASGGSDSLLDLYERLGICN